MKFNCGPKRGEKKVELSEWHPWFAWKPVGVGSCDCRWLETVYRRRVIKYNYCRPYDNIWVWQYKMEGMEL